MRKAIIRSASSTFLAYTSIVFVLIFIMAMQYPEITNRSAPKKPYTYLALGDSYTIGEKVPATDNFPNQVAAGLRALDIDCKAPRIVAKTGWTTDELEEGIESARLRRKYDFVTLLIGVNDQYRGEKVVDYIPKFEKLVQIALKYAGNDTSRLIILSIPDWGVTPFAEGKDRAAIAKEIDDFNAANSLVARQYNLTYLSITASTRRAATDQSLLAEDGLHPSGKEYAIWAQHVINAIRKKID